MKPVKENPYLTQGPQTYNSCLYCYLFGSQNAFIDNLSTLQETKKNPMLVEQCKLQSDRKLCLICYPLTSDTIIYLHDHMHVS